MRPTLLLLLLSLFCAPLYAADDEEAEKAEPSIAYIDLSPSFVSNLSKGAKYMRADIQLMTEQGDKVEEIELHKPALRHAILMLLADQDGKALKTPDGKEALRQAALTAVQDMLKQQTGKKLITDLYFTAFFVK